jgi:hypothetical protein
MALNAVPWGSDTHRPHRNSKRLSKNVSDLSLVAVLAFAVAPLVGTAQAPSVTFVQANAVVPQTPQSSVTVAFASAQAAANLNVIVVGWKDATAHVQSASDAKANVYALAVGPTVRSGFGSQAVYYAKNIQAASAAANVVSVTFDRPAQFPDVRIAEYGGLDQTIPVDVDRLDDLQLSCARHRRGELPLRA